jgi:hypothetical protein
MIQGSNSSRDRRSMSSPNIQIRPSIQRILGFFLGVPVASGQSWPLTSSPKVTDKQSYTSTVTICLHGTDRYYSTFLVLSSTEVALKSPLFVDKDICPSQLWPGHPRFFQGSRSEISHSSSSSALYTNKKWCASHQYLHNSPSFKRISVHQLLVSFRDHLNNVLPWYKNSILISNLTECMTCCKTTYNRDKYAIKIQNR